MSDTPDSLPDLYYALIIDGEIASNFRNCVALEATNAVFQSNPTIVQNDTQNELFNSYDFVVDNEIAYVQRLPKDDAFMNAIFQSSPVVVPLTEQQLEMGIGPGWLWDGTEFTEPT